MKNIVKWAIHHSPGMNTLMIAVLLMGGFCMFTLRRESFPEFDLDMLVVTVPYPGASPEEVEEGICQKIEEAVRSIDGISKQTSVAAEGTGTVVLELEAGIPDAQKVLNEVRSEVDRISTFPVLAEDPEVRQITLRRTAIQVGIVGPDISDEQGELQLRSVAEQIRDELLLLPTVSQAEIQGAKNYQVDIEIPEATLRKYGLTLRDVAQKVRRQNMDLPGGRINASSEQVLLRGRAKKDWGPEIAEIPIITQPNGTVLTVGDLGNVRDEFVDDTFVSRINGRPGLAIVVQRTAREDLLAVIDEVRGFLAKRQLPHGYEFVTWGDESIDVRDRINLLMRNGLQGLILVFIVLALFLEFRLAFWVAMGIPFSLLGACILMLGTDQTMNMISMFGFVMALGIVVDDAIVVGENIYVHRQLGKDFTQAAIDGTQEVMPSVSVSVLTTIMAFAPLLFVAGIMGKFIAVLPAAVISMLVFSLAESLLILPGHLAHQRTLFDVVMNVLFFPFRPILWLFEYLSRHTDTGLNWFVERLYLPSLRWAIHRVPLVLCGLAAIMIACTGFVRGGHVPFVLFPKLDSKLLRASITYPDGTPAAVTADATKRLEEAIRKVDQPFLEAGNSTLVVVHRTVGQASAQDAQGMGNVQSGSHVGSVTLELTDTSQRDIHSDEIIKQWRQLSGDFPGAETVTFGSANVGPGGIPIEFKLLADAKHFDQLSSVVEQVKTRLASYPGVFDVDDDSKPGKWEMQFQIKDDAQSMGVPLAELAETVRASYFGEEVMRLQRGRHEVKLMVRYPREERKSLANLGEVRIRTADRAERPLEELAKVNVDRSYSEINRVDQLRSITITADVDETTANAREVVEDLRKQFLPGLLAAHPSVSVRWEGQQERTKESLQSMFIGFAVALAAMFVLLTFEFRSYVQSFIILSVVPFGMIGAVAGHYLMGLPLTMFSMFGLVALTGVVVNDSIVLLDFINHRVRDGLPVRDALIDAGRRRFRPVLLTSVTTIAGLLPIITETSFQAQILIPMAVSLAFGLLFSTLLVLYLVPCLFLVYSAMLRMMQRITPPEEKHEAPPELVESK